MKPNTGRLDRMIGELRQLYADADEIFNARVSVLLRDLPPGTSFGAVKYRVLEPAGRTIDYIKALDLVRDFIANPRAGT